MIRLKRFHMAWIGVLLCSLILSGCGPDPTPLGQKTLSGVLPPGWEDAPVKGNAVLRVVKPSIPVPLEIVVKPLESKEATVAEGWTRVKAETRPGPAVRQGKETKTISRPVWIYHGKISEDHKYEAIVDRRLNEGDVESFLNSLVVKAAK